MERVQVDISRDLFTVSYDENQTSTDEMFESIKALGYTPTLSVSEFVSSPSIAPEKLPAEVAELIDGTRPISLYFGASWCGACKIMERTTFVDESVKTLLDQFGYLKIDIEEQEEISTAFSIRGVPTLIILDSSGDEVYRRIGPLTPSEITLVLEQYSKE